MMAKLNQLNVLNILDAFASYNYAFHPIQRNFLVSNRYCLMGILDHLAMQIFVVINLLNLVVLDDDLLIWKLILNIQLYKVLNRLDFGRIHTVFERKKKKQKSNYQNIKIIIVCPYRYFEIGKKYIRFEKIKTFINYIQIDWIFLANYREKEFKLNQVKSGQIKKLHTMFIIQ